MAVLTTAALLVGCAPYFKPVVSETEPHIARLSTAEAIHIAKQAAERAGSTLSRYKEPEAYFEFSRKNRHWFIFFDGKEAIPGNHFGVDIDDQTGATWIMPGM